MMRTYWCSSCNIKLYDDKYNEPIAKGEGICPNCRSVVK